MGFHHIRFPLDIALASQGGPQWMTDVVTLASGREERNSRWAHSRRRYNAGYGVKSRADMAAVLAFFQERRGRFHGFLWRDGLDHTSNVTGGAVSATDQAIGTGDGIGKSFALTKRYGTQFDPYVRDITKPVAGDGALMLLTGLAQTLGWDLSALGAVSGPELVMQALAVIFLRRGIKTNTGGV